MRFSWTRGRSMMVVSAALMALQGAPALAQFVPYNGNQNQGYNQYQNQFAQQPQPQYMQAQPQYVASAYQTGGSPTLTQPAESIAPGQMQQSVAPHAAPMQAAPMQSYSAAPAAGCNNCQPAASAPMSYESYPTSAGYAPSTCGTYNTFDNGCGIGAYGAGAGLGNGYLGGRRGYGRGWFGGIYGLYMERDGNPWKPLAFSSPLTNGAGYYPADNEIVLNLTDIDNDTFAGAEVRFGSTFGGGGCGCNCGPRWAWELAYWGLAEDTQTAIVTDLATDANRLYSMLPMDGKWYDADGAGAGARRQIRDYYDYAPPVGTDPVGADVIRVRQLTVRNTFSAQNIELNLLRLPICGGGYYAAAAGAGGGFGRGLGRGGFGGLGSNACGGCDAGGCGVGSCGSCGVGGCGGCGGGYAQRYSVTSVLGVRYLRLDEDFMFRTDFDNETALTSGFLSQNVDVDNHLVGAQFGCNGIYRCGCTGRWALHCNSVVGIYGNHMEVWNRMDAPVGGVVELEDGTVFDLRYEDDDIAVIGELRAGASYQYSCNCRLFGGYRMLGISGVALAFDQISPNASTAAQVSYVDSDGSIFIHGLQAGVELTY